MVEKCLQNISKLMLKESSEVRKPDIIVDQVFKLDRPLTIRERADSLQKIVNQITKSNKIDL